MVIPEWVRSLICFGYFKATRPLLAEAESEYGSINFTPAKFPATNNSENWTAD
jgi:hypothetical protein